MISYRRAITIMPRCQPRVVPLEDRHVPSTVWGLTSTNNLLRFDSASPGTIESTVAIVGLQTAAERAIGIDFRPRTGQLYATTVPVGAASNAMLRTYRVDPQTGSATFVGSIPNNTVSGAADVAGSFDFNPTVDRIRVVNVNDENFRINPNNGTLAGNDPNLNPVFFQIIAEAYDRNFDRANATTIPTTLYGISRSTNSLVVQGGINGAGPGGANGGAITNIGSLGVTLSAGADAGFDITTGAGLGRAFAALTVGTITGLYTINLSTGAATLVGAIGNGATQLTDISVVPDNILVTGADAGGGPHVKVFDARTRAEKFSFFAYGTGFRGGVRVAAADVTGDGVPDIITGAGPGGGPHVKVFDGLSGTEVRSFFAYDAAFTGGVFVASGDVNGDGFDDIITGAGAGGGPHVRVFSGKDGTSLQSFFAYGTAFRGGVNVAAADFNLDGRAEIVTGAGPGGGPHVRVFDGTTAMPVSGAIASFFAYSAAFGGGVFVAAGDVSGDGIPDIITGAGAGGGPHVIAFSGVNANPIQSFFALSASFTNGVRVGVADVNGNGRLDILAVGGPGIGPFVGAFDALTAGSLSTLNAYDPSFIGGVFVGGGR